LTVASTSAATLIFLLSTETELHQRLAGDLLVAHARWLKPPSQRGIRCGALKDETHCPARLPYGLHGNQPAIGAHFQANCHHDVFAKQGTDIFRYGGRNLSRRPWREHDSPSSITM
jgi:hypothetical protein